jgi:hypothetical protein
LPGALDPDRKVVVYIAEGDVFVRSALISAASLLEHNAVQTIVFTSSDVSDASVDYCVDTGRLFGEICRSRVTPLKPLVLSQLRIGPFLYLDADTYVCGDIAPLWLGLERHPLMMAQDTWRFIEIYRHLHPGLEIADGSPTTLFFNSGVLLSRGDEETSGFCADWARIALADERIVRDQIALRALLDSRSIDIGVLPQEYNARTGDPLQLSGKVYVVHEQTIDIATRKTDFAALAEVLNRELCNRLWSPAERRVTVFRY